MYTLVLIRGYEHGLFPVRLLSEIVDSGINIRTISDQESPAPDEIVLVDCTDPKDSLDWIRRMREAGCASSVLLAAPEQDLPPFRELAPLHISALISPPFYRDEVSAALQQVTLQAQRFRSAYIPREEYTSLQESLNLLRMSRLYQQLTAGDLSCLTSLETFNTVCGTAFGPGPLACFGVQVDPVDRNPADWSPRWQYLEDTMGAFFAEQGLYAVRLQMAGFCGVLFSPAGAALEPLAEAFYSALRGAAQLSDHVTVSIAGPAADLSGIPVLLRQTVTGLRNRITLGIDRVIDITKYRMTELPVPRFLSSDRMISLCASIDVGDLASAGVQIDEVFQMLEDTPAISGETIYMTAMRFYEVFRDSRPHGLECGEHGNSDSTFFLDLDNCWNFEMLRALLKYWCRTLLKETDSSRSPAGPVSQSLRYINNNLRQPLSLQQVAKRAGLSPSYFGTLFKQQVGCTFIEYVQSRRISAATRLLAETTETVAEVARQVGFADYRYFSRLFTRITGLTPTQYRRQNHESEEQD